MTEAAATSTAAPTTAPAGGQVVTDTGSTAAPATEAQKAAARYEFAKDPTAIVVIPVDGEMVEMTAAEAAKRLGRGESANKRFEAAAREREEARRERAEADQLVREMAQNIGDPHRFRAFLAQNGITPRQFAQAMIEQEDADARLSPAEKELRAYKAREAAAREANERNQQTMEQQQRAQHREVFNRAFDQVMGAEGVAEDSLERDSIRSLLARAAMHVQKAEGRSITVGEARKVVRAAQQEYATHAQRRMTPEQRMSLITDEDFAAWAAKRSQAQKAPDPAPPLERDRDPQTGQFREAPTSGRQKGVNVNGQRIIRNFADAFDGKL